MKLTDEAADRFNEISSLIRPVAISTGRAWPAEQIEIWVQALSDIPADAIHAAVLRWLGESESGWPMPATIRRMAMEFTHGSLPDWSEAYARVTKAMVYFSGYRPAEARAWLTDVEWLTVLSLGGWETICANNEGNETAKRAQFRNAYESRARKIIERRALPGGLRPKRVPTNGEIARMNGSPKTSGLIESVANNMTAEPKPTKRVELPELKVAAETVAIPDEAEIERRRQGQEAAAKAIIARRERKGSA